MQINGGSNSNSDFSCWGSAEPNGNTNENCIEVNYDAFSGACVGSSYYWNDNSCGAGRLALCQSRGTGKI